MGHAGACVLGTLRSADRDLDHYGYGSAHDGAGRRSDDHGVLYDCHDALSHRFFIRSCGWRLGGQEVHSYRHDLWLGDRVGGCHHARVQHGVSRPARCKLLPGILVGGSECELREAISPMVPGKVDIYRNGHLYPRCNSWWWCHRHEGGTVAGGSAGWLHPRCRLHCSQLSSLDLPWSHLSRW